MHNEQYVCWDDNIACKVKPEVTKNSGSHVDSFLNCIADRVPLIIYQIHMHKRAKGVEVLKRILRRGKPGE